MPDDSQGGLRGDPVDGDGQGARTRDTGWLLKLMELSNHIDELEAALDHLRARLHTQIAQWQAEAAELFKLSEFNYAMRASVAAAILRQRQLQTEQCAADLLAVLTEPPQENKSTQVQDKKDVTRSAETDVIREVPLPHREG